MSDPHYLDLAENRLKSLNGVTVKNVESASGKRKLTVEGISAASARKVLGSMGVPDEHIDATEKDGAVTLEVKE